MVNDNEALRYRRLIFYAADIDQINATLLSFVKKANAQCCLVIDREGHMVAKQGFLAKLDSTALAALVAGSFATTREVARQLGETEFRVLFHQGAQHSIQITMLGERTLQVAVFASSIKPGMIQVFCKELASQLEAILDAAMKRKPDEKEEKGLTSDFSDQAKNQLDSLFGNL
jgi:predicted regulator of Ras-like GTPase activity (Roadblock/LC7/MglB family)